MDNFLICALTATVPPVQNQQEIRVKYKNIYIFSASANQYMQIPVTMQPTVSASFCVFFKILFINLHMESIFLQQRVPYI